MNRDSRASHAHHKTAATGCSHRRFARSPRAPEHARDELEGDRVRGLRAAVFADLDSELGVGPTRPTTGRCTQARWVIAPALSRQRCAELILRANIGRYAPTDVVLDAAPSPSLRLDALLGAGSRGALARTSPRVCLHPSAHVLAATSTDYSTGEAHLPGRATYSWRRQVAWVPKWHISMAFRWSRRVGQRCGSYAAQALWRSGVPAREPDPRLNARSRGCRHSSLGAHRWHPAALRAARLPRAHLRLVRYRRWRSTRRSQNIATAQSYGTVRYARRRIVGSSERGAVRGALLRGAASDGGYHFERRCSPMCRQGVRAADVLDSPQVFADLSTTLPRSWSLQISCAWRRVQALPPGSRSATGEVRAYAAPSQCATRSTPADKTCWAILFPVEGGCSSANGAQCPIGLDEPGGVWCGSLPPRFPRMRAGSPLHPDRPRSAAPTEAAFAAVLSDYSSTAINSARWDGPCSRRSMD